MAEGSDYGAYAVYLMNDQRGVALVRESLLRYGIKVQDLARLPSLKIWEAKRRAALENPSLVLVFVGWGNPYLAAKGEEFGAELDELLSATATKIITVFLPQMFSDWVAELKTRPSANIKLIGGVPTEKSIKGLVSLISQETGRHFKPGSQRAKPVTRRPVRPPVKKRSSGRRLKGGHLHRGRTARPPRRGAVRSTGGTRSSSTQEARHRHRGRGDGPTRLPEKQGDAQFDMTQAPEPSPAPVTVVEGPPSHRGQRAKPPERGSGRPSGPSTSPARVLNANFAHSPRMKKLKKREGLVAGEECCLLVEVGPRWKRSETIAKGRIDLTEVLAGDDDYVIQAAFVSDDFEPKMKSADIWVPAEGDRTFPYVDGHKADHPGPVTLWVRAPRFPKGSRKKSMTAHGRLCLYYKSYLLQSAVVSIGVVRSAGTQLDVDNEITVDFVLTGDFREVRRKFRNRRIRFGKNDEVGRPVTLNLTLNDDGHGQHRILAKHHLNEQTEIGLPPAWKKYDPIAGIDILSQFRTELLTCYEEFDPGKFRNRREKFIADLTSLAVIGSKLYAAAFTDLSVAEGVDAWDWEEKFGQSLSEATVIQISRTGPATYVFPWSMVYEYPLEEGLRSTYESCKTLWDEWDENAVRTKRAELRCPHQDEHLDKMRRAKEAGNTVSIICPYAFWGYKHIIEQPLSAVDQLSSAPEYVSTGGEFDLGIGVTDDLEQRDMHLQDLRTSIPLLHLDPAIPAENRDEVRHMLFAPKLVYFLCHGEKDKGQTYLSIGAHDADPMHMITANTLRQWKRSSVDKSAWQRTHPLIFINGCGTADLRPGLAFDLVSAFADLEVSGVIGTEVSLQTKTAFPAAISILGGLAKGGQLCPAIRDMRWELLAKGDLLGLAYTPYGLADVHVE